MNIGDDVVLEDDLISALVDCGREAHLLAQAHHNDPGSNGFTFGTDRYQRGTELAAEVLMDHGFRVGRRGAGLVARHGCVEVQFAVARGTDLSDPSSFDADSSPARRRAGATNALQAALDGMPEPQTANVVHVVWSGTPEAGQIAVHVGRLFLGAGDRLDWSVLHRVDRVDGMTLPVQSQSNESLPSYIEQPVPAIQLTPKAASSDAG